MKVLLINPWGGEVFPTPAIGYLQATLKAAGVDVTAVDLSGAFKDTDYDIVGVTFHSFLVKQAQRIRHYYKDNRLICSGSVIVGDVPSGSRVIAERNMQYNSVYQGIRVIK